MAISGAFGRPWEQELIRLYPNLFQEAFSGAQQAPLIFGIETGDGWRHLIEAVCQVVAARRTETGLDLRFAQVKEKLGGIRAYLEVGEDLAFAACDAAERLSLFICESCGVPGCLRGPGWYYTACDKHAEGCDRPVGYRWQDVELVGVHPDHLTDESAAIASMPEHNAIAAVMVVDTVALCRDPERMRPSPGCPLIANVNLDDLGLPTFEFEPSEQAVPVDVEGAILLARAYAGIRQ